MPAKRNAIAEFLDYGVFAFGHEKKDYFIRLTKKPLIETREVTFRYVALIDVVILTGLLAGLLGYHWGWIMALFFFVMAVVVFVDSREIERRKRMLGKITVPPVKKVIEATAKTLVKPTKRRKKKKR